MTHGRVFGGNASRKPAVDLFRPKNRVKPMLPELIPCQSLLPISAETLQRQRDLQSTFPDRSRFRCAEAESD
jgi:hypothetical protein